MRRIQGSKGVKRLECVNPVKNKWRIRWDIQEKEDGSASYMEEEYEFKPTLEDIKSTIVRWSNALVDEDILHGLKWKGYTVWLSQENQFNYKAIYDLAVQSNGANLPVVFKIGSDIEPVYEKFSTLDELQEFYIAAVSHINDAVNRGWHIKDANLKEEIWAEI